jgi:hypothetical protein
MFLMHLKKKLSLKQAFNELAYKRIAHVKVFVDKKLIISR